MTFNDDNEALIKAALNGSSFAWEKLVKSYERKIFNYGLRLTGNKTDAMDLTQEVFLGVYRNLHRFRGDARFSSWIFRIAHNKAVDINRRRALLQGGTYSYQENEEVQIPEPGDANEPDLQAIKGQQNREILSLLQLLPLEQRLVVELKIYQSHTFEEIAQLQEISENTAKTRFYSALKKLKAIMQEKSYALP
jgi:RNA polymerase sigma-70 factor (ECF subfamily)